ncbi:MAG: hypothetical protein ACXIUZ_00745 [Lysobacteraceae bacterium]
MKTHAPLFVPTLFEVDESLVKRLGLVQEEDTVPASTLEELLALDEGTDADGVAL